MLRTRSSTVSTGDPSAASHPRQGAERCPLPCGRLDFSTELLTPCFLLGRKSWVSCGGKRQQVFSSSFFQSVLQTSSRPFFTIGEKLTCQHQFLASLQNSNPGKVQPICWFSSIFSLPKTQSLPKKLLQLCGSQLAGTCSCSREHTAGHDATRMPSAYQIQGFGCCHQTSVGLARGCPAPHAALHQHSPIISSLCHQICIALGTHVGVDRLRSGL